MYKRREWRKSLLSPMIVAALFAVPSGAETLTLEIRHLWEGEKLSLPTGELPTRAGETIRLTRLSYLLSEPSLQPMIGDRLGRDDWFAYADLGSEPITFSLSGIPEGKYVSLRFNLGLNEETDQSDPNQYAASHPLNPNVNKLHWTPQGGYIFLALEGYLQSAGEPELGFAYHVGKSANRARVPIAFHLELRGDKTIQLDFHVDRLFNAEPALVVSEQTSTHSREGDPIPPLLASRIPVAFTLRGMKETETRSSPSKPVAADVVGTPYRFVVRKNFPIPALPEDFPLTNERVALGRQLFHDPILSGDNSISCASCHLQSSAFTDGKPVSTGVGGETGERNSMPLFNLAWKSSFFWDGRAPTLRTQVMDPIEDPVEMHSDLAALVGELADSPGYGKWFAAAFGDRAITEERLGVALEQFLLTLTSYDSTFDRAAAGKAQLSDEEKRGFELFMTEYDPRREQFGADCFHCHGGAFFTDHGFHNNGLEAGEDLGLEAHTGNESDRHKFSTPSLRNVALTAPYMHDGRLKTLDEVVAHYATGIHRSPTLDPNLAKHPGNGIPLTPEDRAALVAFLHTLTDPQFDSGE